MTFNFDPETWFKITLHLSSKETLRVKYESDWVKGRDDMLRTSDVRWTDRPTERLFIIGHPNSRARALIEFIHLQFDEII